MRKDETMPRYSRGYLPSRAEGFSPLTSGSLSLIFLEWRVLPRRGGFSGFPMYSSNNDLSDLDKMSPAWKGILEREATLSNTEIQL